MKLRTSGLVAMSVGFALPTVFAQALNDPARHGMQVLPRVAGCDAPGGLQPITSSDGPNDAMFWCGTPPYCLTMTVGSPERCHIIPGSRNGGTAGVRDPQDLLCDATSVNPVGGRCGNAPTLSASINNVSNATVNQGAGFTMRINTQNPAANSTPTSFSMSCSGTNAVYSPFNITNLMPYAGLDQIFPMATAANSGVTTCTISAQNAIGTSNATVSLTASPAPAPPPPPPPPPPAPPPTVEAYFNPTNPLAYDGRVDVYTRATNATLLYWRCSGRWNVSYRERPVTYPNWYRTGQNVSGSPGTATCVFTAQGPGGSASVTRSWTSRAP